MPKRKATSEVLDLTGPEYSDASGPATKKTRSNPTRASRSKTTQAAGTFESVPVATKKPRASRAKKASASAAAEFEPTGVGSSSAVPLAGPSQPSVSAPAPSKRGKGKGKKKADPDDDDAGPSGSPEKRGAVFKPKCPQNIMERVHRVMTQRLFMIDRHRNDGELREEFSVLGSTGNVYTVTIDHKPRCNCPDAMKGNHCKHIVGSGFAQLHAAVSLTLTNNTPPVLQVPQSSGHWYQKALLTSELQEIFANAPLAPNSIAHAHVREAHARATGKISADAPATPTPAADTGKKRIPGPEDDCPICYDGMHGVPEKNLVFCEECGNALHGECFAQWKQTARAQYKPLTCVWCRAAWVDPSSLHSAAAGLAPGVNGVPGAVQSYRTNGYLNLAGVAGVSPVRDTSSYYHGPRTGQRYYGYREYWD
ncbi:hypothetical protein CVT26_002650 [Gymnopilus dilepis]|uniref:SWIM-type domain-containing protein n=1 Tax=Gymnopilus dilepis TaxID=231916 RepID=A0A409VCL0_9AGAR|nr:hypothetical protein CVT26_002650 [Gymnopilus dilepis]